MSNPLQFSVEFGKSAPGQRPGPGAPLRILFMTDLGDGCRSRKDRTAETRPIRAVDIDGFEAMFATERPVVQLPDGDLTLHEIDDLHPDRLCRNLSALRNLSELRGRLQTPASFEHAAQEVRSILQADVKATPPDPATESDADTLSRLFGATAEPPAASFAPASASEGFLTGLLRDAVAEHIVPDSDPRAEQYVAAIDAAATVQLRAILHDPAFQAVEAAWRGLGLLVSGVETDEELSIHVWNVAKRELLDAMGPSDSPPEQSMLHQRLVEEQEDAPFTLIVSDIDFGNDPFEMRLLATLGAIAGRTGAVVLASTAPALIGAASWEAFATAPEAVAEPDPGWQALRASPMAGRIAAFAPHFLLRSPYGKRLDPIDAFPFEEVAQPATNQKAFLWAAPAVLATILIARSFREDGWDARLNSNLEFDDLPLVAFETDGVPMMKPCAAAQLSERAAEAILQAGPVPLVAIRNRNAVRLPWFQTISDAGGNGRFGPFNC